MQAATVPRVSSVQHNQLHGKISSKTHQYMYEEFRWLRMIHYHNSTYSLRKPFMLDLCLSGQKQDRRERKRHDVKDKQAESRVSCSSDTHHDTAGQWLQSERIILTNPLQSHSQPPPHHHPHRYISLLSLTHLLPNTATLTEEMKEDYR